VEMVYCSGVGDDLFQRKKLEDQQGRRTVRGSSEGHRFQGLDYTKRVSYFCHLS
jgi:hypothetical protein